MPVDQINPSKACHSPIYPDTASLNRSGNLVSLVRVACEDARPQAVDGVVGERNGLSVGLEGGGGDDRPEYLFLKHAHFVVSLENGGLDVVATVDCFPYVAAHHHLGALLLAQLDVSLDFVVLLFGGLGTHHDRGIQGVSHFDGLGASDDLGHELVEYVLVLGGWGGVWGGVWCGGGRARGEGRGKRERERGRRQG